MSKKAASVRYDEEKLNLAIELTGAKSLQKVLDYFLDGLWIERYPPKKIEIKSAEIVKNGDVAVGRFVFEEVDVEKESDTAYDYQKKRLAKTELENTIADIKPSGLKFKNKPTDDVMPQKQVEAAETPKNDKILEQIKQIDEEINTLGVGGLATMRKKFLLKNKSTLQKQLK